LFEKQDSIEVIENSENDTNSGDVFIEVAGAFEKPGVYEFKEGARLEDLLIASGGISVDADRAWIKKMMNRAAKLIDRQKYTLRDKISSLMF
jgi:competence protein ComEA